MVNLDLPQITQICADGVERHRIYFLQSAQRTQRIFLSADCTDFTDRSEYRSKAYVEGSRGIKQARLFYPLETLHIGPDALASVPLTECEGPLSDLVIVNSLINSEHSLRGVGPHGPEAAGPARHREPARSGEAGGSV